MLSFEEKVYVACARIPKGKVSTYGAIAKRIGSPRAARAVGNTLNKNPVSFLSHTKMKVPCHRVVRSDGYVGGFAFGQKKKIALLKKEGVQINNRGVVIAKFIL